ncbi:unnamed protein product [Prunus brigantina]
MYDSNGETIVKLIDNDSVICEMVGYITSNRVLVLYYTDNKTSEKTWTQTSVEWPSLQSEEYNYGRFNEDHMKEDNEALDTDEDVVSLGDCEAVVDEEEEEEEEEPEYVDSDYEFSEDEEANKGCNVDINMPCDEEVNVETETQTQGPGEISDDWADSDTLYSYGNTSDDENTSRHCTKKQRIRLPKFKQYRRATDLKNPEFHLGMQFANREHLKEAIKEIDKEESTFVVKAIHADHTCGRVDKLRYANSTWISERFCDKMRRNPNWTAGQLQDETNPGSTVVIKTELSGDDALFERIYICLAGSKKGFLEGCRPVVGVDGCHLKGPCSGQILTAVGVDGNNVLPNTEHRMCVRHLYNTGLALKHLLWAAARATTLPWWEAEMDNLKREDADAWGWLIERTAKNWSRSHFATHYKCDLLLNNLCESFNAAIIDARDKPILTCLERIRMYIMIRMANRRASCQHWRYTVGPRIFNIIEKNKLASSQCIPRLAGEKKYQPKLMLPKPKLQLPKPKIMLPKPRLQLLKPKIQLPKPKPNPKLKPKPKLKPFLQISKQGQWQQPRVVEVAATKGGTSRGRMRGFGRSSSQPHALPPNVQGSAPIGPNQMAQLVASTRGGRGRGRMRGFGRSSRLYLWNNQWCIIFTAIKMNVVL